MKHKVYFGSYSEYLYRGEFDDETGGLKLRDSVDVKSPSYVVIDGDFLYGVSETDSYNGENGGSLFSVSIKDDNEMKLISNQGTNGKHPCHLCVKNGSVFAANYSEGTLSIFKRDNDGSVKPSHMSIAHYGKSVNTNRQEKAHIHFAAMSPGGNYLTVCDLGMDMVFMYPYSESTGLSTDAKIIGCPAGSGPRHLVFSQSGKTMYVLAELGNFIMVFKETDGSFKLVQEIATIPAEFKEASTAAAIHISPDGSRIAASNRGHDSIVIYDIKTDETLENPEYIKTGKVPRDFGFSPDGKWILSANQEDSTVTVYCMENKGEAASLSIPRPVCITFQLSKGSF